MTKRLTLAFATLLLATFQIPLPAQETPSADLVIVDLRPPEEKEGTGLSALEGKCNKDVYRIADVARVRSRSTCCARTSRRCSTWEKARR